MNTITLDGHTFEIPEHPLFGFPGTILDLGGNQGSFAKACLIQFPQAKVISYEPTPGLLKSDNERWEVIEKFVAVSAAGETDFYINEKSPWDNSAFYVNSEKSKKIRVQSESFDWICQLFRPDWVKMDIEGAEYPIILKSNWLFKPKQVSVEFHDFIDGERTKVYNCIARMLELGYSLVYTRPLPNYKQGTKFVDTLFILQ